MARGLGTDDYDRNPITLVVPQRLFDEAVICRFPSTGLNVITILNPNVRMPHYVNGSLLHHRGKSVFPNH